MDQVTVISRAKVNLTLEVFGKRADGYHDIDSIVQVIDLADTLLLEKCAENSITVTVESGDAPSGPDNLIYKACEVFFKETGVASGVTVKLSKMVPAQAGLGGGSANAASAIIALDRLFDTSLDDKELAKLAASVGSDAPLFIYGGTVRMQGRGERISVLPDAPALDLVIIKPEAGISTAWAYGKLDERADLPNAGASDAMESAISSGDRCALVARLYNDFDPIISSVCFEVSRAKKCLMEAGAENVLLAGSGSAVFGVFPSGAEAQSVVGGLEDEFGRVYITRTLTRRDSSPFAG